MESTQMAPSVEAAAETAADAENAGAQDFVEIVESPSLELDESTDTGPDQGEVADAVEEPGGTVDEPETPAAIDEVPDEPAEMSEPPVQQPSADTEGRDDLPEAEGLASDGTEPAEVSGPAVNQPLADTEDREDITESEGMVGEGPEPAASSEMGGLPVEDWDYQEPKRGQVRKGVILSIREQEIIVDVDAKRDGLVPYADIQRMGPEAIAELSAGDEVRVFILRPEDQDGNLLVSLYQARQAKAWERAAKLAETGEVLEEEVIGYNKGGLVVPVDNIRGFVPASQVPGFPQSLSQEARLQRLSEKVGEKLQVKVIEINRRNRRLILSATAAQRDWRKIQRKRLLDELREGEVRSGVVSSLCSFGAFVDLGGADGLVHLSELSWRRVRHPREVINVGDEVEVYVLRLDKKKKRIGLSLKRLQPEPWALVEDKYELGQLVEGTVTNVVDFGVFAEIEEGVEGLIHVSELANAPISHPREVVKKADLLLLRIIRIDIRRKRLGLSLKRVLEAEWAEWAARVALAEAEKAAAAEEAAEAARAEEPEEVLEQPEETIEEAAELPVAEGDLPEDEQRAESEPEDVEPPPAVDVDLEAAVEEPPDEPEPEEAAPAQVEREPEVDVGLVEEPATDGAEEQVPELGDVEETLEDSEISDVDETDVEAEVEASADSTEETDPLPEEPDVPEPTESVTALAEELVESEDLSTEELEAVVEGEEPGDAPELPDVDELVEAQEISEAEVEVPAVAEVAGTPEAPAIKEDEGSEQLDASTQEDDDPDAPALSNVTEPLLEESELVEGNEEEPGAMDPNEDGSVQATDETNAAEPESTAA